MEESSKETKTESGKSLPNGIKPNIGRVHSIQSFGTVDGPGLRTVIFFQGCPLKCKYCHNIDMGDSRLGKEYTPEQLVNEVIKYKEYWIGKDGGVKGGVTFSGGEPTFQSDFIMEVAKQLKEKGVHTTIDTCFGTAKFVVDKLYPVMDYWMVSIKHLIREEHAKLTEVLNQHILENIEHLDLRLAEHSRNSLRIRFLVIPGITDSEEHIHMLGEYLQKLKSLDFVEVLPYGTHGRFKWIEIYGNYELDGVPDATKEDVEKVKAILVKYNIKVQPNK